MLTIKEKYYQLGLELRKEFCTIKNKKSTEERFIIEKPVITKTLKVEVYYLFDVIPVFFKTKKEHWYF